MYMIYFQCDYAEGAHPSIIEALSRTNLMQSPGYSTDSFTESAKEKIRKRLKRDDVDIHFLVGGTQANLIIIASALRPYQGVISADTGHIATHETGAIEATGHKVITLPGKDGKITAGQIEEYCAYHYSLSNREHTVMPGMVYLSFSTETGTNYTKKEIEDIHKVCLKYDMMLFIDGARMGYALAAEGNDISFEDFPSLCDVFYIGGTKCGALFGEGVVIMNDRLKQDFRYMIKQRGAMFAKGRLLGLQFDCLFTDDLYFKITKKAVDQALRIKRAFNTKGIKSFGSSMTNQQFLIMDKKTQEHFSRKYVMEFTEPFDDEHDVIRCCTSWATTDENVEELIRDIEKL